MSALCEALYYSVVLTSIYRFATCSGKIFSLGTQMGMQQEVEEPSTSKSGISEEEAALYDRQIRLWGVEAQKRLREAKVLIIGLGGLGAEIAKNVTLAGAKSITLLDDKNVSPIDRTSNFFLTRAKDGENRAEASQSDVKELNPNVHIICDSGHVQEKNADFFTQFDIVCATNCQVEDLIKINEICREHSIKFICGDVWGFFGYCFIDLGSFSYLAAVEKKAHDKPEFIIKKSQFESVIEKVEFVSLSKALSCKSGKAGIGLTKRISKVFFLMHILNKFHETNKRWPAPEHRAEDIETLKSLRATVMPDLGFDESKVSDSDLSLVFGELSPICAIVGGFFGQEVIKAISANEAPMKNFFLFDGPDSCGIVENIGC